MLSVSIILSSRPSLPRLLFGTIFINTPRLIVAWTGFNPRFINKYNLIIDSHQLLFM